MVDPRWDEVGQRFAELGRQVQDRWRREAAGTGADEAKIRDAMQGMHESLDSFAAAITRTVNDPAVHDAATTATSGFIDALASSLADLSARLSTRPPADGAPEDGDDPSA